MKPHCEARSQEASQSSEGTDVVAFFFFLLWGNGQVQQNLNGVAKEKTFFYKV